MDMGKQKSEENKRDTYVTKEKIRSGIPWDLIENADGV